MIIPFVKTLYGLGPAERLIAELLEDDSRYDDLLTELEHNGLGLYTAYLLQTSEVRLELPGSFRERLKRLQLAGFAQNMLIRKETEALLHKLDGCGIPVIPLKGTMLAERYFGSFSARGTSDIDLLVRPEHLEAAVQCVREAGYDQPAADSPIHYHTEWMKDAPGLPEPLTVELHWSLTSSSSAAMRLDEAWRHSEPLSGFRHARICSAAYTFYALCLHGASHQMDSNKHIIDLMHMIVRHHEDISLPEVLQLARQDRTLGRVKAAMSVVYALAPELSERLPLPFRTAVRFWKRAFLQRGSEPHSDGFKLRRWLFTFHMLDSWPYRWRHVRQLLLPSVQLAAYSVDDADARSSTAGLYLRLYRQRLRKLMGG